MIKGEAGPERPSPGSFPAAPRLSFPPERPPTPRPSLWCHPEMIACPGARRGVEWRSEAAQDFHEKKGETSFFNFSFRSCLKPQPALLHPAVVRIRSQEGGEEGGGSLGAKLVSPFGWESESFITLSEQGGEASGGICDTMRLRLMTITAPNYLNPGPFLSGDRCYSGPALVMNNAPPPKSTSEASNKCRAAESCDSIRRHFLPLKKIQLQLQRLLV